MAKLDQVLRAVRDLTANQRRLYADVQATRTAVAEILDSRRANMKRAGPDIVPAVTDDMAIIGVEGNRYEMLKDEVCDAFAKARNRQDYCLKLLDKVFSKEELFASNYNGGDTQIGTGDTKRVVKKRKLRDDYKFRAIVGQMVKDFGDFKSDDDIRKLKDAVNGKCRKTKV